jgi:hypothetical protein
MRKPSLAHPPRFSLSQRDGPRVTLTADTGAVAHIFVAEEDIFRVLLLTQGKVTSAPSWAVAPGQSDIDEPGRDRMSVEGFAAPDFSIDETETHQHRHRPPSRGDRARWIFCTWHQMVGGTWQLTAQDRPTQAYNFGWWDDGVYHYVTRQSGERYYALGEKAGAMDRAGRRFRLTNLDPMGYDAGANDPLYKSIPYVLVVNAEGAAHGVFYDTTADPTFDFGHEHDNYHPHYRYMRAESGDLDYYMIAGPDAREVTRRYTWLTGRPAFHAALGGGLFRIDHDLYRCAKRAGEDGRIHRGTGASRHSVRAFTCPQAIPRSATSVTFFIGILKSSPMFAALCNPMPMPGWNWSPTSSPHCWSPIRSMPNWRKRDGSCRTPMATRLSANSGTRSALCRFHQPGCGGMVARTGDAAIAGIWHPFDLE